MRLIIVILILSFSTSALNAQRGLMKKADYAHIVEKDYLKSLSLYSKAADRKPKNDMALNGIGMALYRLERYEESLNIYNQAIKLNNENLTLYANRANTYLAMNQPTLAMKDLDLVLELNPSDAISYNNRGMVKNYNEDYDGALLDYNKAIEIGPVSADNYNNRGVTYWDKGEFKNAELDYLRAIAIDETYAPVYANYGMLLLEASSRPKEAILNLEKALALGFNKEGIFYRLGYAFEVIGQFIQAEQYYTLAIKENQENQDSYFNRGSVRANLQNYDGALEDYQAALSVDSLDTGVLTNRALLVYDMIGNYPQAIIDLQRCIEINESNGEPDPYDYNNLGYLQYKNNNLKGAQANVEISIQLDSLNSYAYRNLALIKIAQGELEEACLNVEKAISFGFIEQYGNEILEIKKEACD